MQTTMADNQHGILFLIEKKQKLRNSPKKDTEPESPKETGNYENSEY